MPVRLDLADDVARLTIDKPEKRNALALSDLAELSQRLDEAAAARPRALVLTGAGDRAFSAGVDLGDVAAEDLSEANPLTTFCDKLQAFPHVTIARLNGAVIGGAAEISLSCDFRVGVEGMKLMVPAARIGLHYETPGLARAAAIMGWPATKQIYLLARTMQADQLMTLGYLDGLAPNDSLDDAIDALIAEIRGAAPLAIDGMAQTIREMQAGREDPARTRKRIAASWASEDLKEGLAAIKARRKPSFTGR